LAKADPDACGTSVRIRFGGERLLVADLQPSRPALDSYAKQQIDGSKRDHIV
jgi:hypothetical protein